jgi:hypothetical protein
MLSQNLSTKSYSSLHLSQKKDQISDDVDWGTLVDAGVITITAKIAGGGKSTEIRKLLTTLNGNTTVIAPFAHQAMQLIPHNCKLCKHIAKCSIASAVDGITDITCRSYTQYAVSVLGSKDHVDTYGSYRYVTTQNGNFWFGTLDVIMSKVAHDVAKKIDLSGDEFENGHSKSYIYSDIALDGVKNLVVDEAQCFTSVDQYTNICKMINYVTKNGGNVYIFLDPFQNILAGKVAKKSIETYKKVLVDGVTFYKKIPVTTVDGVSYRIPTAVMTYATKLLTSLNDGSVKIDPEFCTKSTVKGSVVKVDSVKSFVIYKKNRGNPVILCTTNELVGHYKKLYPYVTVSTIHGYQGRESDDILLVTNFPKFYSSDMNYMTKLVYVALTRTTDKFSYCFDNTVDSASRYCDLGKMLY